MQKILKFFIIGIVLFLGVSKTFSQPPPVLWTKTYGGSNWDFSVSGQETDDKGFILVGWFETIRPPWDDVWLIKTDSLGNTLWTKRYGGDAWDRGLSVQQTRDKGYIIAGFTQSFGQGTQLWLLKTDSLGDTLWTKILGGENEDWATCVQQTTDNGYIIAGHTKSYGSGGFDVWLIKTDSLGNIQWTKTYGGTNDDFANYVQQTDDGGYIVIGETKSYGSGGDIWLIKTDSLGDTLWTKTFGGNDEECGYCVQEVEDGYILTGGTKSFGAGNWDVWLIKTTRAGTQYWQRTFGGADEDCAYYVHPTSDLGYILAGYTYSFRYPEDGWIIRTDSIGDTLWTLILGGSHCDRTYMVKGTHDNGYIIIGSTYSYGAGGWDAWLIRLGRENVAVEEISKEKNKVRVSPNPFSNHLFISGTFDKLNVYNSFGRLVATIRNGIWDGRGTDGKKIPPGIYFLKDSHSNDAIISVIKLNK